MARGRGRGRKQPTTQRGAPTKKPKPVPVSVQVEEDEDEPMNMELDVEIHSIKSYRGTEGCKELKQAATEELELLTFLTGIKRRPPIVNPSEAEQTSQPANTSASNRKGKGRAKAKQTQEAGPSTTRPRKAEPGILPEDYHERARYWDFYSFRNPPKGAVAKKIRPQIDYINDLMKGWRPTNQKMGMPEEWFAEETTVILSNYRSWNYENYDREKVNRKRMSLYLEPISEHLERIATKNLIRRHLSTRISQFRLPDFCLPFRVTRPSGNSKSSNIEIYPCLERFLEVMNLPMGEDNVELCVMTAFTNIPVCWMVSTPTQRWLDPLAADDYSQRIEFALVYNSWRPCDAEQVKLARKTEISYANPAVLVAMKGPIQWPEFVRKWDQPFLFNLPQWQAFDADTRRDYCIEDLACAVQPSLDALVLTWFLRVEQQVIPKRDPDSDFPMYPLAEEDEDISDFLSDPDDEEPTPDHLDWEDPPEWAWIPGILYDYEKCYLVAHIPILPQLGRDTPVEYVSYLFDELPMARPANGDEDDRECLVERVRLGLAWMSLAKHAFKVTSLWESVVQPLQVLRHEELAGLGEYKHGFTERPPSPKRHVTRRQRFETDDNLWLRKHYPNAAEESVRAYQDITMDDFLEMDPRDEDRWEKRYAKDVKLLKKQVTPRIEKWKKGIEQPDEEYFEGVVFDDDEFLPLHGLH